MSEERKRILEMLAEGKLTVDEAERLLVAIDDGPRAEDARPPGPDEAEDDIFRDLGREIRAGVAEAGAAIAELGPELASIFRDPDRFARRTERTRSRRRGQGNGDDRYPEKYVREEAETKAAEPGTRVSVRNARGNVRFETSRTPEVTCEASIVARARTQEEAQHLAERVEIDVLDADNAVRIETRLPNEQGELRGYWQANLVIRIPEGSDIETETRHGKTGIPDIDADVSVRNAHGVTRIGSVSGSLRVRQGHGNITVGSVGADAALDVRHGDLDFGDIARDLSLRNEHGHAAVGSIGGDLDLFSAHGPVTTGGIAGSVQARLRHAGLDVEGDIGCAVSADASHGTLNANTIGGDLTSTVRHGSVEVGRVGGNLDVDTSHSPVTVEHVGHDAKIRSRHARVALSDIQGNTDVETSRSHVVITGAKGRVDARDARGALRLAGVSGDLIVTEDRGSVAVIPDGPVTHDIRIEANRSHIDLVLPEGSDLDVRGALQRGEVGGSIPGIDVTDAGRNVTLSGRLGNGAAAVEVKGTRSVLRLATEESALPNRNNFDF